MTHAQRSFAAATALFALLATAAAQTPAPTETPAPTHTPPVFQAPAPEVPYVPTPDEVVREMLELAKVESRDTVYDLGSGDGRIVIAAAKDFGAHGVGIDIDPERIAESRANAETAGVSERVRFIQQDLFGADLKEATVVTLYLLPGVNNRLKPKLLAELRPGTRVVSHSFDIEGWDPAKTKESYGRTLYLWIVPPRTAER